jgi:hypothetical protein
MVHLGNARYRMLCHSRHDFGQEGRIVIECRGNCYYTAAGLVIGQSVCKSAAASA